jgi:hypothetical protein
MPQAGGQSSEHQTHPHQPEKNHKPLVVYLVWCNDPPVGVGYRSASGYTPMGCPEKLRTSYQRLLRKLKRGCPPWRPRDKSMNGIARDTRARPQLAVAFT